VSTSALGRTSLRTTSRVSAIVAGLACAIAFGSSAAPATASVRWNDGNISEVRFICGAGSVTVRATSYTYSGLNNYNHFRYTAYSWSSGTWSSWTDWEPVGTSYTFSVPRGGNYTLYVEYLHRNTTDGRLATYKEWGEVLTSRGYESGGRCYT
jgi:hypothetical protein